MDELLNVLYGSGKARYKKTIIIAASVAAVIIAAAFSAYKLSDTDAQTAAYLPTSEIAETHQSETAQTSAEIEIVTAAPSFDPYCPTVMYGLPSHEDEEYIRGRLVIDLANTEKVAADDPSDLLKIKPSGGSPIESIDSTSPVEKETASNVMNVGILYLPPVINSFSEYVNEHGFDFEKDKPVYSYVNEDMDGDGENEYYICAALSLNTSETAYLLYYKESGGRIELICCGKLYEKNCESVFERDAQIFYRSGEKYLLADIRNDISRYIELHGNSFTMVDKENEKGQ